MGVWPPVRYLSGGMPKQLAQSDGAADRHVAGPDGWHELAVANPTFLLERLGSECTDLQGLRELTVNGLDAVAALGADSSGRVVWDLDWERFDASDGRVRKLSVIDTGTGMTAEQLRRLHQPVGGEWSRAVADRELRRGSKGGRGVAEPPRTRIPLLAPRSRLSGALQAPPGRALGARAAALGRRPQPITGDRCGEAEKPWLLRGEDHGTQVVLLGEHERHDTTQPPRSVTEARREWITRYLNGRFVRLPARVEVLVREDHARGEPGQLRRIHGEREPPRAPRRRGGRGRAERRGRALVGARRRSSRPASRSRSVGFHRSRRRGARR